MTTRHDAAPAALAPVPAPGDASRPAVAASMQAALPPGRLTAAEAGTIAAYAQDYATAMTTLWASPGGTLRDAEAARGAFLGAVRVVTDGRTATEALSPAEVQALGLVADGLAAAWIEAAAHPVTRWQARRQQGQSRAAGGAA